jgi:peptide/nickel transport system ATP-binding protein/oligopeptide transport system ATP-binding protein
VTALLEVRDLKVHYPVRAGVLQRTVGHVKAVDGVSLTVERGETLGLVGESGCGKSTLSRALVRLVQPTSGEILFEGRDIVRPDRTAARQAHRDIQIIFQDPVSSLNPRFRVKDIILEGLRIQGLTRGADEDGIVADILRKVGLPPETAGRFPHALSGGQRQRIGIARTLVLEPKLIVADEPVSALDVSIQSQVLNLLVDLRRELGLTFVFVAHNLAVVSYIADRIAVMYLGRIVELAPSAGLHANALHPYTVALMSAMPDVEAGQSRRRIRLKGEMPSPMAPPSGCRFRTRCPIARDICATQDPPLAERAAGHLVACHFAGELASPFAAQEGSLQPPSAASAAARSAAL